MYFFKDIFWPKRYSGAKSELLNKTNYKMIKFIKSYRASFVPVYDVVLRIR